MIPIKNPFVINTYYGDKYFCDREKQTKDMISMLTNGHNVVLTGPRRVGKSNFISHIFAQPEISDIFTTIEVDIYSSKSMTDFVDLLSKAILKSLKSRGRKFVESFVSYLKSLQPGMSFDINGMPTWTIAAVPYPYQPEITLDEIFEYIEKSESPCIIAIDEFQRITRFPNPETVEATLRTYIQKCTNVLFVFSGSNQRMMTQMFGTDNRPFYQSALLMYMPKLELDVYADFCMRLFRESNKGIKYDTVSEVYKITEGITAYMQKILNMLFTRTSTHDEARLQDIEPAIDNILENSQDIYAGIFNLMTQRQRQVITAIAKEREAQAVLSSSFVKKYHLGSASIVQSCIKTLLEKDLITQNDSGYSVTDFFFGLWLKRQ